MRSESLPTIFLAGDVMTGRGIDQIMRQPSAPELHERWASSAATYVELAERVNGPVPAPVDPSYVWGDALEVLERERPAGSIINLETSITTSDTFWPGKAVHYRMHPGNVACLQAAHVDLCVLANNHALDFGVDGLRETIAVLNAAGIATVGAGENVEEASRPAPLQLGRGLRALVFAFGTASSGIPRAWAAASSSPGVHLLPDLSERTADECLARVRARRTARDIVVVSIHWGSNWGYDVASEQIAFARRLVEGGVDLIHGHSSHHVRPIEVHRRRAILYGCGDLLTDYEGIGGHEQFRGDLGIMVFATLAPDRSIFMRLVPMRMRRLRLERAEPADATWLWRTLNRISRPFRARFERGKDDTLIVSD